MVTRQLGLKRFMGVTPFDYKKKKKQDVRTAMSSVQLSVSNFETPKGSSPQRARRSVCRSLFGPVDHDELNRDIEAKLREISERDQKRWNFNFVSGTPLHGEYEWEGAAVAATPAFYQETVQVGKRRAAVGPQVKPNTEAPDWENSMWDEAARAVVSDDRTSTGAPSCTTRTRRKTSTRFTATSTSRITGRRAAGLKKKKNPG